MLKPKKKWHKNDTAKEALNDEQVASFAMSLNQPAFLIRLAMSRGYTTEESIKDYFFEPTTYHDPFLLYDMERLVERLTTAIKQQEKILVYGDYDADGITSTAILMETLENLGADVSYYLPDRFEDGYGPNQAVYQYYIRQGIQLILTCDNGVSGHEAIAYANSHGVDVLVTDHHELPETLPDAYAIVHPRHPKGQYPFGDLCGAGVALKVSSALMGELPIEQLDLAAIGTVADMVSLTDENRFIVKQGIEQIKRSERVGLATFLEEESFTPQTIDEETISFTIAPHLNALGRLKQAGPGVELMLTFDPDVAKQIVSEMIKTNQARKQMVSDMTQAVFQRLKQLAALPPIIVMADASWHEGILGIVSNRVAETTHRPTILLSHNTEIHIYKGSGRSIEGVNLFEVLTQVSEEMEQWGGHAMAAGMSVSEDQFATWQADLVEAMVPYQDALNEPATLEYDMTLPLSAFTIENIEALNVLKPFGAGNPKPAFLVPDVQWKQVQAIGQDKQTLKVTAITDNGDLSLIGFKLGNQAHLLQGEGSADFILTMAINEWNNQQQAQGFILDMKSEQPALFDLRQAANRQLVFNVTEALYVFESKRYFDAYQSAIPESSRGILMADLNTAKLEETNRAYRSLVIFDCVHDRDQLRELIQVCQIQNVYLFAYTSQHAYTIGQPMRQEFAKLYQYLVRHPGIQLQGNERAVAGYLRLSTEKVQLMLKTFVEGELISFNQGQLVIQQPTQTVDIGQLPIMQAWQQQIRSERFFLYTDLGQIKAFLFGN
ncbi:MAG: single-stranded-DNA-specific exonuclease RecJ [Aerococcus sp.]|nr:single-stranded-DNA-specific exonuclease RecJ [Aerococcus sp.]